MPTDDTTAVTRRRRSRDSVPRAEQRPPQGKGEEGRKANPLFDEGFSQIADRWYEAMIAAKYPPGLKDFLHAIARLTWGYGHFDHRRLTDEMIGGLLGGVSTTVVQKKKSLALQYRMIEMVAVRDSHGHRECWYRLTPPEQWIPHSPSGRGLNAQFSTGVGVDAQLNDGVEPPVEPRGCTQDIDFHGIERNGPLGEPRSILKVTEEEGERVEQARPQLTQLWKALRLCGDLEPPRYVHLPLDGARPDGPTVGSTLINAVNAGKPAVQTVAVNIAGRPGWLDAVGVPRPDDRSLLADGAARHVYLCRVLAAGLRRPASEPHRPGADTADRKTDNGPPA